MSRPVRPSDHVRDIDLHAGPAMGDQWDIPTFDLGGPVREDDIEQTMADDVAREQNEIDRDP